MSTAIQQNNSDVIDASFEVIESNPVKSIELYDITDAKIAHLEAQSALITAKDAESYTEAIAFYKNVKRIRIDLENRRKFLVADSVAKQKRYNAEHKRVSAPVEAVELKIAAIVGEYEAAIAKAKADEEAAKQAEIDKRTSERIAQLAAVDCMANPFMVADMTTEHFADMLAEQSAVFANKQAKAAIEAAARKAEQAKFDEERARLAAERAELEKMRAETVRRQFAFPQLHERPPWIIDKRNQEEREAIELERAKVQEEKDCIEREEFAKSEAIRIEQEAVERAEREAIAKAELERLAAEAQAIELARLEAIKPDLDKFRGFAAYLRGVIVPGASSDDGQKMAQICRDELAQLAIRCERFGA